MTPGAFLLRAVLAMVPAFLIWWFIGSEWLRPAVYLCEQILHVVMPKVFHEMNLSGDSVLALTHWERVPAGFIPAAQVGTSLGTEFNVRILSYSFPFFISLQVAIWQKPAVLKLVSSLLVLYLIFIVSLAFVIAKQLIVNLQLLPVFQQTTSDWVYYPDVVSMGFQIATLLLPTLVPVVLWAFCNRDYITTLVGDGRS